MSSEAIQLRPVGLIPPSSAGNCYSELLLFDLADFLHKGGNLLRCGGLPSFDLHECSLFTTELPATVKKTHP